MGNSPVPFSVDRSLLRLDREQPYLCLHFIVIFVRDQERSLRFYLDQLGFRLVVDHTFEARRPLDRIYPTGRQREP